MASPAAYSSTSTAPTASFFHHRQVAHLNHSITAPENSCLTLNLLHLFTSISLLNDVFLNLHCLLFQDPHHHGNHRALDHGQATSSCLGRRLAFVQVLKREATLQCLPAARRPPRASSFSSPRHPVHLRLRPSICAAPPSETRASLATWSCTGRLATPKQAHD
jgi:hypothetical protein